MDSGDHQGMNRMVWWTGLDQWRAEVSEIDLGSDRLSASGVQIGVDPLPYRLDYSVVTGSGFVTERIDVVVKGAGWGRRLDLRRDPSGQWSCDVDTPGRRTCPPPVATCRQSLGLWIAISAARYPPTRCPYAATTCTAGPEPSTL